MHDGGARGNPTAIVVQRVAVPDFDEVIGK